MLYDFQYDIAAIVATVTLFVVYFIRRSYATKANRILMLLITCDFFAALLDYLSCFTISYSSQYPEWYCNFTALGYLFFYNMMAVLYFMYIDAKARIGFFKIPATIVSVGYTVFYAFSIFSSPWTHLVAYFDNGVYKHGPVMIPLYVLSFICFILELFMLLYARRKFSPYQLFSSIAFVITTAACIAIQMMNPRLLIGQFGFAMVIFFTFMAYENPAHYNHRDTRCYNKDAFIEAVKVYFDNPKNKQMSLVALSIDDFSHISHSSVVATINELASRIAERMRDEFKKNVFCFSDDRFVIMVPRNGEPGNYVTKAEMLFDKPFELASGRLDISGTAYTLPDLDSSFSSAEICEVIDYYLSHPGDGELTLSVVKDIIKTSRRREELVRAIQRAIKDDGFMVFYQPILNTFTGRFESAEALIRLVDDELGYIDPQELILTAEETGYMVQIGEIVFKKVCEFISEHDLQSLGVRCIEVNVSPLQLGGLDSASDFTKIISRYNIEPSFICFEITDTKNTINEKRFVRNIKALSDMGFRFAADDYGMGFASAEYLFKLPVTLVKIDKEMLWQAMNNQDVMIVLKNNVKILKELGKEIVVEGVETDKMEDLLVNMGCDFLQGFKYSKPVRYNEYISYLKAKNVSRPIIGRMRI